MKNTEQIDMLFLELSQFTTATTSKEIALKAEVEKLREEKLTLYRALILCTKNSTAINLGAKEIDKSISHWTTKAGEAEWNQSIRE